MPLYTAHQVSSLCGPAGDPAGIELAASTAARAQDESTDAAADLLAMDTGADETADILLNESEGLT